MSTATGYWASAAIAAAVDLGLFEAVAAGDQQSEDQPGATVDALAQRCEADEGHLRILLDALAGLGLVSRDGDPPAYRLHPDVQPWLDPTSPTCMLPALAYNVDLLRLWTQLPDCIRKGQPAVPVQHLGLDPQRTRRFAMGMHSRALALGPALIARVDLSDVTHMLDLASGPGTYSRQLAERFANLRVTLFDLPAVLDVAEELTGDHPAAERFTFQPGDYRSDPLPADMDAVWYCGALHQESPDTAARLLARLTSCLKPAGRLIIVDMMLDDTDAQPVFSALFSLNMLLTSPFGRVHRASAVQAMLRDAGYTDITATQAAPTPYWIIEARRPDAS